LSRYFFHVMDGHALIDAEGTELINLADARKQAITTAGDMLSDKGGEFWGGGRAWTMSVADADGLVVFTLQFSADDHGISDPSLSPS
jgi:hypothetical protein